MKQDCLNSAQIRMGLNIPSGLDGKLAEILCSPQFTGAFEASVCREASSRANLIGLARAFSVAPISGVNVGALAVGTSGQCYLGANMEFTGVPLHASLHAEQSAVINAWMHGEPAMQALYVSEPPCGHCRQFLFELHAAAELPIIVENVSKTLTELMPEAFALPRPEGQSLLDSPPKRLRPIHPDASPQTQSAVNAAGRSYTPYSQSPEGFIIETINGQHFAGRMAESIALNPSVSPVISALNQMNLSAQRKVPISRGTHARMANALTETTAFSEAIMRGICSAPIETVLMESAE